MSGNKYLLEMIMSKSIYKSLFYEAKLLFNSSAYEDLQYDVQIILFG